jgi:hypothetical protein
MERYDITYIGHKKDWTGLREVWMKVGEFELVFLLKTELDFVKFEKLYRHNPSRALHFLRVVGIEEVK